MTAPVVDLGALREACALVTGWWRHFLLTGEADADTLADALAGLRALGPVPGRFGAVLAYLVEGCPEADDVEVADVLAIVAAVGRGGGLPELTDAQVLAAWMPQETEAGGGHPSSGERGRR